MTPWYTITNSDQLDTPALVVYPDRVQENINRLIRSIDDVSRLRPHIKTHKSAEVAAMLIAAGIKKVKCSTIAEGEMLATAGMPDVLLAYQPVGPKIDRFADLIEKFPTTKFSCLIDDIQTAQAIDTVAGSRGLIINVFIDLNIGMNRTGILPESADQLWKHVQVLNNILVIGLHAYDGHLRDPDHVIRKQQCDEAFAHVIALHKSLSAHSELTIVAGGTPTYSIHSQRKNIECSPGTFIYWDIGYEKILQEQHYLHAALVITRVISKPADNLVCVDLGHKAIASENPLGSRVHFLNAEVEAMSHSEEHMVLRITNLNSLNIGDVLYGIPFHVCPTVALHDRAYTAVNHSVTGYWNTLSRNRFISI